MGRHHHGDPAWPVRVDDVDGNPWGAGVLLDDRHVLTCAHVVRRAGGAPGGTAAGVRVTSLACRPEWSRPARVVPGSWVHREATLRRDVALLRLDEPADCGIRTVLRRAPVSSGIVRVQGFPEDGTRALPVDAELGGHGGREAEWALLKPPAPGTPWIEGGYSGAGVMAMDGRFKGRVIGIVVARYEAESGRAAWMMPTETIEYYLSDHIAGFVDGDRTNRIGPPDAVRRGDVLDDSLRLALTRELTRLLDSDWSGTAVVVTGGTTGAGASWLVRLAGTADPASRAVVPDGVLSAAPQGTVLSLGAIDAAYDARGRSVADVRAYLVGRFGLSDGGDRDVLLQLLRRRPPASLVVGGVDTADDPDELVRALLGPLARRARSRGVRLVLGFENRPPAGLAHDVFLDPEPLRRAPGRLMRAAEAQEAVRRLAEDEAAALPLVAEAATFAGAPAMPPSVAPRLRVRLAAARDTAPNAEPGRVRRIFVDQPAASGAVHRKAEDRPRTGRTRMTPATRRGAVLGAFPHCPERAWEVPPPTPFRQWGSRGPTKIRRTRPSRDPRRGGHRCGRRRAVPDRRGAAGRRPPGPARRPGAVPAPGRAVPPRGGPAARRALQPRGPRTAHRTDPPAEGAAPGRPLRRRGQPAGGTGRSRDMTEGGAMAVRSRQDCGRGEIGGQGVCTACGRRPTGSARDAGHGLADAPARQRPEAGVPTVRPNPWYGLELAEALGPGTVAESAPPAASLSREPVPEAERYCANPRCQGEVGRGHGGAPGRIAGFCPRCRTPFDFAVPVGRIVAGRYTIEGRLGSGANGTAYLAHDRNLRAGVVLKALKHTSVASTAEGEREALVDLRHDNIVRILDFESEGPYLVLEFVPGVQLSARRDIPPAVLLGHGIRILQALDHLHGKGLLHCDVKPSNVIRFPVERRDAPGGRAEEPERREGVRLIDFGSVRKQREPGPIESFTEAYAPPPSDPEWSRPTEGFDLFCLGRTLQRLCGSHPNMSATTPGADSLRLVLERATDTAVPQRRFATARQFGEQLSGVIRQVAAGSGYQVIRASALFGPMPTALHGGLGAARPLMHWVAASPDDEARLSMPEPFRTPRTPDIAMALPAPLQIPDDPDMTESSKSALAGPTSGWPGADWIADILLAEGKAPAYRKWLYGARSWQDTEQAWETWRAMLGTDIGKAARVEFDTATEGMTGERPTCSLAHGALSAMNFPSRLSPGKDYDFVPFSSSGHLQVSADFVGMFTDRPAARSLLAYLSGSRAQQAWVNYRQGYAISASSGVPVNAYRNPVQRRIAAMLQPESGYRLCFSAADAMAPDLTAAFYRAVLDYATGAARLQDLLSGLQRIQDDRGGSPVPDDDLCTR
ncbi:serine/threonine protein kinase [Streptomyces sp. TS71-3]|uniref:protein kinase domain-containing protein n=1 Tax=Streptomyces sp. TS71-3 TaxID=2733862 RepID=UPI001B0B88ED|nr:serine/threonine protein kinase [Streptomyces sp. TS71-3]GHJ40918.1 hypothetical protein Sm713_65270 [Streptomyces sp. TS71-3]